MGIFAALGRSSTAPDAPGGRRGSAPGLSAGLTPSPVEVPHEPGFEAVAEALMGGRSPLEACLAVGREMALSGASVDEALTGLRITWLAGTGDDPSYDAVAALVRAWSESTLSVVNDISCEDPLTGLGSAAHMRSCLTALYRAQRQGGVPPRDSHALVVVDLPHDRHGDAESRDSLSRALRMATLGDAARTVFPGTEVIGRLSGNRIAVLGVRDPRLGVRVRLLRRLVDGMELSGHAPRVWIEGLPATDTASGVLLDELARS